MPRSVFLIGACIAVLLGALFAIGFVRSPVSADRDRLSHELANIPADAATAKLAEPDYQSWQAHITGQSSMWQPLVSAPAAAIAAPNLSQMLAGVQPTRNQTGRGDAAKVQISVDGAKGWYSKGQQIKGCTIKSIADGAVSFSLVQNGQEYDVNVPRK